MKENEENIETLLIAYVEGQLSGAEEAKVATRIQTDMKIKSQYEAYLMLHRLMESSPEEVPNARLRHNVQQLIDDEKQLANRQVVPMKSRTTPRWLSVAAAVTLIAIGAVVGRFWLENQRQQDEVVALQQELANTKELLAQVVNGNLSASQRLARIQGSYQLEKADPEVLNTLIRTMNTDTNVNVRIAAIKALTGFVDHQTAREALVQSLITQEDPFIQLTLINILVRVREDKAIPQFEKLLEDKTLDQTVQDEAQSGIFRLS